MVDKMVNKLERWGRLWMAGGETSTLLRRAGLNGETFQRKVAKNAKIAKTETFGYRLFNGSPLRR
jgi:hypothetical protein